MLEWHVPVYLVIYTVGDGAQGFLGKHSTHGATPPAPNSVYNMYPCYLPRSAQMPCMGVIISLIQQRTKLNMADYGVFRSFLHCQLQALTLISAWLNSSLQLHPAPL